MPLAELVALREKCSTEIGAMTGLLLAVFDERVDASPEGGAESGSAESCFLY